VIGAAARQWLKTGRADLPVSPDARQRVPAKTGFEKLPAAIQRRVLQSQLAELGVAPDFDLIESLRQSADSFVSVGPKMSVARDAGGTVLLRAEPISKFNVREQAVKLGRTGEATFGNRKFRWHLQPWKQSVLPPKEAGVEVFDADKIGGDIVLQHWRAGDRFQPIGLESAAKLQDLFVNAKISAKRRRELVLATTADGEIFWVEGLRISECFKLTPETRRLLVWRWRYDWP